jgi:hypothetical protein
VAGVRQHRYKMSSGSRNGAVGAPGPRQEVDASTAMAMLNAARVLRALQRRTAAGTPLSRSLANSG